MYSKLLREKGLDNVILGKNYNFRYATQKEKVAEDLKNALKKNNLSLDNIYSANQVHGYDVKYCDGDNGEDFSYGRIFMNTDGLITDRKNIGLLIKFADCTPVVLYDPIKKVQSIVHSGWRSTVEKISVVALNKMIKEYGCSLENIIAFIGPTIDVDNYEVGIEVYEKFSGFEDRNEFFIPYKEKYKLNMLKVNLNILLKAGIKMDNIDIYKGSTFLNENLHSARRDGTDYGLNSMITILR